MRSMSMAVTDERIRLFVGRERECDALNAWLAIPNAPTRIIALTGMGGIGKSTLLIRLLQLAQDHGAVSAWVDARTCYRTPKGFEEALPASYQQWATTDAPRKKLVLGIDNFEELQVLEGWLREIFMGSMPDENVLLVVASRTDLMRVWYTDPVWRPYIDVWPLTEFSDAEVDDFLNRRSVPGSARIKSLIGSAAHHPLALALATDAMARYHDDDFATIQNLVAETLSGRLIREIANQELQPLIDVLILVAESNQDLLQRVLQRRVPVRQYHDLMQLSFVRRTGLGVGLHDLAQTVLFHDFKERDPGGLRMLRERIARVLLSDLSVARPDQRGPLVQQLLWICRDIFSPPRTYADLVGASPELLPTGFDPKDADHLKQFVSDWSRQSFPLPKNLSLQLLDDVIANFPGTIRVARDSFGEPQAMFCSLPLYNQTLALMERYHPFMVKRLLSLDLGITRCAVHEAKATYMVLVGVNTHQSRYTSQELIGAMVRDQFAQSAGLISLLLVTNPNLKEFARSLGFVGQPFPASDSSVDEELFMLDMRHMHFGTWMNKLIGIGPVSGDINPAELQEILSNLHDPNVLSRSSLAALLGVDGYTLSQRICQELNAASAASPLTDRDCKVLRTTYLPHRSSPVQCAAALHISRATYYRYLNDALTHLSLRLQQAIN